MLVGGTYYIESVVASKNATEVVSGENAELAAIDSPEMIIEELGLLASDPAHGYKIEPQGLKERDVGLALEERGDLG